MQDRLLPNKTSDRPSYDANTPNQHPVYLELGEEVFSEQPIQPDPLGLLRLQQVGGDVELVQQQQAAHPVHHHADLGTRPAGSRHRRAPIGGETPSVATASTTRTADWCRTTRHTPGCSFHKSYLQTAA